MSTFKTHVDVRSDHFPITVTEMKKWEDKKIGNTSLVLVILLIQIFLLDVIAMSKMTADF